MKIFIVALILIAVQMGIAAETSKKVAGDYNPILSGVVKRAQQECNKFRLQNGNETKNETMLLCVKYTKYDSRSMKTNESIRKSLIPWEGKWVWVVSFGSVWTNKPVMVGGGCLVIIPDSEKMEVAYAIGTK